MDRIYKIDQDSRLNPVNPETILSLLSTFPSSIRISVASDGLLIPAGAGTVFLFGATQHCQRALWSQVRAGNDDRIQ